MSWGRGSALPILRLQSSQDVKSNSFECSSRRLQFVLCSGVDPAAPLYNVSMPLMRLWGGFWCWTCHQMERPFIHADEQQVPLACDTIKRIFQGSSAASLHSMLEDHAQCGPPQSLQLVTSMGLCEWRTESLFKAAQSKHMINTSCPSPLGPIIRSFPKPLILLPVQGQRRCFKVALYDTCAGYLILPLRISMEGMPSSKVIH